MLSRNLLLRFTLFVHCAFFCTRGHGQSVYRSLHPAYEATHFISELRIEKDSSVLYRGYYENTNAIYSLCKGTLKKVNDSSYAFIYRPVVFFGGDARYRQRTDSFYVRYETVDSVRTPHTFRLMASSGASLVVDLQDSVSQCFQLKGANKESFTINTGFRDPVTQKEIIVTVDPLSEPVLQYYSTTTSTVTGRIVSRNGKLVVLQGAHSGIIVENIFTRIQ